VERREATRVMSRVQPRVRRRTVAAARGLVEGDDGDSSQSIAPPMGLGGASGSGAAGTAPEEEEEELWQGEEEEEDMYLEASPPTSSFGMLRDIMVVGVPEMLR
jgi:hypothetical protein